MPLPPDGRGCWPRAVQVGLVLEEVEVAPRLVLGVVHRAGRLVAALDRAGEPSTAGKSRRRSRRPSVTLKSVCVTIHGSCRPSRASPPRRASLRASPRTVTTLWSRRAVEGNISVKSTQSSEEPIPGVLVNSSVYARAWQDAGYSSTRARVLPDQVRFVRTSAGEVVAGTPDAEPWSYRRNVLSTGTFVGDGGGSDAIESVPNR